MAVRTTRYLDVPQRVDELGADLPPSLVFLPDNFEAAVADGTLHFHGEVTTLRKILAAGGIDAIGLGAASHTHAFIHNRSHDWAMPVLFIGAELLKQNPDLIGQALGLVQQYVIDRFKGMTGGRTIKAELVVEDRKAGQYNRLTYEGPPEGIGELTRALKSLGRRR